MSGFLLDKVAEFPPNGFGELARLARDEGYSFLDRMIERSEWPAFRAAGAVLFEARSRNILIGIGGLTADPFDPAPERLRVRHVYVRPDCRHSGHGALLARAIITHGEIFARELRLRVPDERAARFWERQGFRPEAGLNHSHHMIFV